MDITTAIIVTEADISKPDYLQKFKPPNMDYWMFNIPKSMYNTVSVVIYIDRDNEHHIINKWKSAIDIRERELAMLEFDHNIHMTNQMAEEYSKDELNVIVLSNESKVAREKLLQATDENYPPEAYDWVNTLIKYNKRLKSKLK